MTHETTAPVQSLTDEMLDELEASTIAYMRDVADGSVSPPRPYNDYAAISGESVLELIATVRQQQALIAQQGAPVAVLERANGIIEWMACRADICPKDMRRLEESSAELRALLAAAPTPPAQQSQWVLSQYLPTKDMRIETFGTIRGGQNETLHFEGFHFHGATAVDGAEVLIRCVIGRLVALLDARRGDTAAPEQAEQQCPQCAGTGYDCPDCINAAEQDAVKVPRELLEQIVIAESQGDGPALREAVDELRVLLGGGA